MKHLFLVFIGGGTGSVLRYYLSTFIQGYFLIAFPFGILGVNILACFLMGLVAGTADHIINLSPVSRFFLITGFCGGLSTFSAFSYESVQLMQEGKYLYLVLYNAISILVCFAATLGAIFLGSRI